MGWSRKVEGKVSLLRGFTLGRRIGSGDASGASPEYDEEASPAVARVSVSPLATSTGPCPDTLMEEQQNGWVGSGEGSPEAALTLSAAGGVAGEEVPLPKCSKPACASAMPPQQSMLTRANLSLWGGCRKGGHMPLAVDADHDEVEI